MNFVIFMFILGCQLSFAEEEFKVFVNTFDKEMDTSSIESKNVLVKKGLDAPVSEVALLPSPPKMEKLFLAADLKTEIKDLDQMDRDILFMKVQRGVSSLDEKKAEALRKMIGSKNQEGP